MNAGIGRRSVLGMIGAAGAASLMPAAAAATESRRRPVVYLGSYTSAGDPPGRGLEVATRSSDGSLTVRRVIPGVPDASWFAFAPDRRTLYATNEQQSSGTVTALDLRDPERPRVLGARSAHGSGPTHTSVHPCGRYLLTANYFSGNVVVHPILRGGELGEATDVVQHEGKEPHAHQVVTDPSERWVLAVDLGTDSVYVSRLDERRGTLHSHSRLRLPAGTGPRHLAFHPNGRFAYVLGELRPEITVAAWDAGRGTLTPGQVVPTVPDDAPGPNYPGEIAVSGDSRFVYASNRGENTIAVFAVGEHGKSLRRLENTPTGGNWPRHFTLDPAQRRIYVANQRSGTVTWLTRDPRTGLLAPPSGALTVPSVATVVFG